MGSAASILDVGCGTGALEPEIMAYTRAYVTAIDIDHSRVQYAKNQFKANWISGDGSNLPLPGNTFDISLCHFLLLWLQDPIAVLLEMKRVTRPGGAILILAEPDYTHRIDFPDELAIIGKLQSESLSKQGANPAIGRSIGNLMHLSGIQVEEVGLSGGQWQPTESNHDAELEWKMIRTDLGEALTNQALGDMEQIDLRTRSNGERILYVPTFYAIGRVVK